MPNHGEDDQETVPIFAKKEPNLLREATQRVAEGLSLSMDDMAAAIDQIISGAAGRDEMADFLSALHRKGETVEEVAGAALALRRHMTPIRCRHPVVLDTCGTGGDGSKTFNISTAAALVTAAAGVPVAKHGNRAVTSRSGSADVLTALGVNVEADVPCIEGCLDQLGICFCFAPLLHRAMRHVAPVRASLPHPTIFNILGPLSNPAQAPYQLLGVGRPALRRLMAAALAKLGSRRALVVHGSDGLDEVSLAAATDVTEVRQDELRELRWTPEDFGLRAAGLEPLVVAGPEQSAAVIREILAGSAGPARDIVVLNAAAALWTAGYGDSPCECSQAAAAAIDSGRAADLLRQLARATAG